MNLKKLILKIANVFAQPKQQSLPGHFYFKGYQLPERLVHLTGSGPDVFEILSDNQIRYFKDLTGLQPQHHVIEIGCGIGKGAIPLTQYLKSADCYLGIDVIADSIAWCSAEITQRHPNFRFIHFDVKDKLHHPAGHLEQRDIRIPQTDGTVDRIFLMSVFTHMLQPDLEHYLHEFHRVLVPGGQVLATVFIYDTQVLHHAKQTNLTQYGLFFDNVYADGCRINNLEYPTGAVAYTLEKLEAMINACGLTLARTPLRGHWSGDPRFYAEAVDGQDILVLQKPL